VDTSNLDFVANSDDYLTIKHAIFDKRYEKGVNRITF
jgi:hypothetical protein